MLVDLTMELGPSTPTHPAHPRPSIQPLAKIYYHGSNTCLLVFADHTATHVDAPIHYTTNGKTIDQIELSKFMGKLITIDVSDLPPRGEASLKLFEERIPKGVEIGPGWIVAFRTGYDIYAFRDYEKWLQHPAISPELAKYLAELGINAVGVDSPNPDLSYSRMEAEAMGKPFHPVHKILLSHEILIYENLTNLAPLLGRVAQFYGLPLKIQGGTGSPVRAIAFI